MEINIINEKDAPVSYRPTKEELYDMYWNKKMSIYQVADNTRYSPQSIWGIMRDYNIPRRSMSDAKRIYYINKDFFKIWSYEMTYVLGYFCADGTIHKNLTFFSFCSNDKELLHGVRSTMRSEHPIKKDNRCDKYYLTITYCEMVQDLLNLGITPNKSLTLEFPEIPEKYLSSFIRGVFDGDGSVGVYNNAIRVIISSGSDRFTFKLQSELYRNDIKSYLRRHYGQLSGIQIQSKSEVKKFYDFIYQHDGVFLKRKKDIFDKFFNGVDM